MAIEIKSILDNRTDLQLNLFAFGFYASTKPISDATDYPFYGNWIFYEFSNLNIYVHPKQTCYFYNDKKYTFILIGHAYDPFKMVTDENQILKQLASNINDDFFDRISKLTGIFTLIWKENDSDWKILGDATCMQNCFYGVIDDDIFISTHENLIGDILSLETDLYVEELINYKFFPLLGASLPGDLSKFKNIHRLVPNHYVELNNMQVTRYYLPERKTSSYREIVEETAQLLYNNMKLISEKWNSRAAISMTGGCDSKTTLSCCNGLYDKFRYFSYISSESEKVDAIAAKKICETVINKDSHTTYVISPNDSDFDDIELHRAIIYYNSGSLCAINKNDVRKRCFFNAVNDFDIEVKSWASEIGRAYYSKRFNNRTKFPLKPSPRICTTFYKFFLHNRKLVKQTDCIFNKYLNKYFKQSKTIPWQEQFFWEYRVSAWNGRVITGEHRYSFDITIPYNNTYILENLLSVDLPDRISDRLYKDIRELMNIDIDKDNISIQNLKHTKTRAVFENVYYTIHSKIPF